MIKTLSCLLLLLPLAVLLHGCKKDKADDPPPPGPIAAYNRVLSVREIGALAEIK